MDKHLTWDSFGGYLRTWSSLHTYLSSHPDDANAPGAEGKDIAARFRERLRAAAREVDEQRERSASENVTLRWPVGMMMLRKKA